jgi:hypothetical protein
MSLQYRYQGQAVGDTKPDVNLTGDPAVDQVTLRAAGYAGGKIMTQINSLTAGRGPVIVPLDGSDAALPVGTLINGAGNYAESIGPSGSGLMPVVRALPVFDLKNDPIDPDCFEAAPTTPYTIGCPLFADGTAAHVGRWTSDSPKAGAFVCGICDHVPTAAEPWLGVKQLF